MVLEHLRDVHLVDMVGREDADPVRVEKRDQVQVLVNGVGRPLEPALPAPHLRGNERYEIVSSPQRAAEVPAALDVFVQGLALELDENVNGKNAAVDEI